MNPHKTSLMDAGEIVERTKWQGATLPQPEVVEVS